MLLACVLVGEYLSRKRKDQHFVLEQNGVGKTTAEGNDAFQCLYRMEYNSFLKLSTISSPQVHVYDEMSRRRTGEDSITVEIMLHCLLRWLGGGSYLDIRLSTGFRKLHFTVTYKVNGCNFGL